jgi:HEAT repeat protein
MKMMKPTTRRSVSQNRKKNLVPLAKLRASEVVRTVVNHPRRLQELATMLEDRHRAVRDRAATILARLSESHPGRLLRILDRMKDALSDESAYVRWHVAYCLGRIGSKFPMRSRRFLSELGMRLEDDNSVVRFLTCKALVRIAKKKPALVRQQVFESSKRDVPDALARVFQQSKSSVEKSRHR